jgi:hypothetical protein
MGMATSSMGEDYWESFRLEDADVEFIYNHLLEIETPLTSPELVEALVNERIRRRRLEIERQRTAGGDLYQPKRTFKTEQTLIFPAFGWKHGKVVSVRPGNNPELGPFEVIKVALEDGVQREFAAGIPDHKLNEPPKIVDDFNHLDKNTVLKIYSEDLIKALEEGLEKNADFVRIAGRWFARALLVDVNAGHLNLAEAVLDMAGGGPITTPALLEQVELSADVNPKLIEFSMDLALQEDARFDEVGPAGKTLWFLHRLEPNEVLNTPLYLRYHEADYDRSALSPEMLALELALDDELSPPPGKSQPLSLVELRLIYPHWRSGTLPLSARLGHLLPTAYEAPRVRFMLVDGDNGERFPGWVVRERRYVYGLQEWYEKRNVMPGTILRVRKGDQPGEVVIQTDNRRPSREWIRTVLVGSDGGVVFAMLKQVVATTYDERMAIAIPDRKALDQVWEAGQKVHTPFERVVVNTVRELAKLNPQSHVHASELYAAVNILRRSPPGPILALLASRPWFVHVGDLHFRLSDTVYD